ncbi:MAG: restriction endonuclease subunit R, partial [Nanoarchaeota archaeon]|nr:restriction endonuclease subunit R [Nanoarchaeota archaeon]
NMFKKTEYGRRLIDLVAGTNPIIIIDEPQSVEGTKTKLSLKEFNPLFTLRYSATHKEIFNLVYQLDAVDAFNQKLVKKINVKGIEIKGTTGTNSYMYLEGIDISKTHNPKARIEIEVKQKDKIVKKIFKLDEGDDLFTKSNELEQYKGYKVSKISGLDNSVSFTNGHVIFSGDVNGEINESHVRRIQIRETIKSHINKEKQFFKHGIKIISLFFIDKVDKYRQYLEDGTPNNGEYAKVFEEEYENIINSLEFENDEYVNYLKNISSNSTHEGYFSIDKKTNRLVDPKETGKANSKTCNDVDAFDLIMKNKERLLNLNEPVRFIFSHSALKEGWDNPNVFQICILRNNDSTLVKKRQEIGRGLRLCVNQEGIRVDEDYDLLDANKVNVLTIVANESYEKFAGALQSEFEENLRERPTKLTEDYLYKNKIAGNKISEALAKKIIYDFRVQQYVDENDSITQKFKEDVEKGEVKIRDELKEHLPEIITIVKKLYEVSDKIEIGNEKDVEIKNKLNSN